MQVRKNEHGWTTDSDEWEPTGLRGFSRYGGEEAIFIHDVGMQDGAYTGIVVYEVVDSPIKFEAFETKGVEDKVNDIIDSLLN